MVIIFINRSLFVSPEGKTWNEQSWRQQFNFNQAIPHSRPSAMPSITSSNIPVRELITQRNRKRMDNNISGSASPHSMSPFLTSPLSYGQLQPKGALLRVAAEPALPPMPMHQHPTHQQPQQQLQLQHQHHHPYHNSQSSQKRQLSPSSMESYRNYDRPPPIKREKLASADQKRESFGEKAIQRRRSPG